MERKLAQLKDLEDIRITHLILDRNAEKIKLPHRVLGLQGKEGNLVFPHHFVQIRPRRIDPLAPYVLPAVKHIIQDLDTQMGHTNLIYIGKTHGKADIHLVFIFHHGIHLAADVAGRFFNIQ